MTLEELIPIYGENNTEYNSLKKIVAEESAEIKELLKAKKLDEKTVDGWTAKVTVKRSESFNENKLLAVVKELGLQEQLVKTKEYVDTDALEELIYNGTITQDMLLRIAYAKEVKETRALTVKKIK